MVVKTGSSTDWTQPRRNVGRTADADRRRRTAAARHSTFRRHGSRPLGHGASVTATHVVDTSVVDSDAIVARRVRIVVAAVLIPLITAAVIAMIVMWPGGGVKVPSYQTNTAPAAR